MRCATAPEWTWSGNGMVAHRLYSIRPDGVNPGGQAISWTRRLWGWCRTGGWSWASCVRSNSSRSSGAGRSLIGLLLRLVHLDLGLTRPASLEGRPVGLIEVGVEPVHAQASIRAEQPDLV